MVQFKFDREQLPKLALFIALAIIGPAFYIAAYVGFTHIIYSFYQLNNPQFDYTTGCLKSAKPGSCTSLGHPQAMCFENNMLPCYLYSAVAFTSVPIIITMVKMACDSFLEIPDTNVELDTVKEHLINMD